MLEAMAWEKNCFVTLTYEKVPENGTLVQKHVQDYIKAIRYRLLPEKIRYYYCGEYGEKTERPHYHMALFNVGRESRKILDYCWDKGFVKVGDLNKSSARYIASYVTKGYDQVNKWSEEWLDGRLPEFSRMSRRPGIGMPTMISMIDIMKRKGVKKCDYVIIGGKRFFLDRFLRKKADEGLGYEDRKLDYYDYQIQLFDAFIKQGSNFKNELLEHFKKNRKQAEKRVKIFRQRRKF